MTERQEAMTQALEEAFDTFFGKGSLRSKPDDEQISVDEGTIRRKIQEKVEASDAEVSEFLDIFMAENDMYRQGTMIVFGDRPDPRGCA